MDLGDEPEIVFEPDVELEWLLGPDVEIVFTPETEDE